MTGRVCVVPKDGGLLDCTTRQTLLNLLAEL